MPEIPSLTATQSAQMLRSKDLSVLEVIDAHMQHLERVNPALNAVVDVVEHVDELARKMDRAHPGADAPPLWGVPVTVKSNVDQIGHANSNGLPALKNNVCAADTNTPELSLRWFTSNPLHGVTRNPRNLALTPGGSSGGAAAAVAAGIGTIGHGNDLGGSLRYPAFCCGVASIKPSMGRVPAYNPSAVAERPPITAAMSVQGPIARNIADVRLGLNALARRSVLDPMWTNAVHSRRSDNTPVRDGYSKDLYADGPNDAAITKSMNDALGAFRTAGIETVEIDMPRADRAVALWGELLFAETELMMGDLINSSTSPAFKQMYSGYVDAYSRLDFASYIAGCSERAGIRRDVAALFDEVDLFLMPTSMSVPFENDYDFKCPEKLPEIIAAQRPLQLVNFLGLPSVALPTGMTSDIPVGVQLMGPMHSDAFVLDVAEVLEGELGTLGLAQI